MRREAKTPLTLVVGLLVLIVGCAVDDSAEDDAGSSDVVAFEVVFCGNDEHCDDGNDCSIGVCTEAGVCEYTFADPGVLCDDQNMCTENDRCDKGCVCVGETNLICNDDNPCTDDACDPFIGCVFPPKEDGAPCEDGSMCSIVDSCLDGECVAAEFMECPDSKPNDCFVPACDAATGLCDKTEQLLEGHPCCCVARPASPPVA